MRHDLNKDRYLRMRLEELHPDLHNLVSKLIGMGGRYCNIPFDSLNKRIFDEGTVYINQVKEFPMDAQQCHKNAWQLHTEKGYSLHSGYVLGTDDNWYRHSWVIDRDNFIIETTYPKETVNYFGISLTELNFLEFLIMTGQCHSKYCRGIPSPL
jgi:hypothetical protein